MVFISAASKWILLYFQANASRWLCHKTWRSRFFLQRHASGCKHKLGLQLQEEVSLPVAPADLHPILHTLHPIHFSEPLTVCLQVCHLTITHSFAGKCVRVHHRCRWAQHVFVLSLGVLPFAGNDQNAQTCEHFGSFAPSAFISCHIHLSWYVFMAHNDDMTSSSSDYFTSASF